MKRLAIILPPIEIYHPHYGGAVSRVVRNQFSDSSFNDMRVKVFGRCKDTGSKLATSRPYWFFECLFRLNYVLRKLRLNHWCWCLGIAPLIRGADHVLIENRPQFAVIFRKLFPHKRIFLRLHSDFSHWGKDAIKTFCDAADRVIYCSEAMKTRVEHEYVPAKSKGFVVYNGSDSKIFRPCARKKENQILFVGRIAPIKGVLLLLDVFEVLLEKFEDLTLVIVGSSTWGGETDPDSYEKRVNLRAGEINAHFPGSVLMKGYVNNADLPRIYSESTFLAMPSLCHEAFGLVAAESMLCGTVVVGSSYGGIREVVGESGTTCIPELAAMTAAFTDLIEDPARRGKMEQLAIERSRSRFCWEVSSAAMFTCLEKAMHGS